MIGRSVNSCTQKAAKEAYEMAGLGPEDIDLIELHDCFATAEILLTATAFANKRMRAK